MKRKKSFLKRNNKFLLVSSIVLFSLIVIVGAVYFMGYKGFFKINVNVPFVGQVQYFSCSSNSDCGGGLNVCSQGKCYATGELPKYQQGDVQKTCVDSDRSDDSDSQPSVYGVCSSSVNGVFEDACASLTTVSEKSCGSDFSCHSNIIDCNQGFGMVCKNGACVMP